MLGEMFQEDEFSRSSSINKLCTGIDKGKMLVNLLFMPEGTGTSVQCQLDTGATCNVMSHETLCDIMKRKNPKVSKSIKSCDLPIDQKFYAELKKVYFGGLKSNPEPLEPKNKICWP
jgi:hypothetical protein